MRRLTVFVIGILIVAVVAGCIAPPPVEEAQQAVESEESELCTAIEAYAESLVALNGVTADTTVDELNSLNEAAGQAFMAMRAEWGDLQEAEIQAVESAVAELETALNNVPAEATLGETAVAIQEYITPVQAAVDQLDQIVCAPSQ